MANYLKWPNESATQPGNQGTWQQPGSNICLDFHGDPVLAEMVIFSDGNHHMALQEVIQKFLQQNTELIDIFYATTPPNVLIKSLEQKGITLGNLVISRKPDVFIAPANIMQSLLERNIIASHQPFAQSRGNVLLIKKDNPKNIISVEDVLRPDVMLFISNPETEKASFQVYSDTLYALCKQQGIDKQLMQSKLSWESICTIFGEKIHHREAPQAIYSNTADVAMVYFHLALRYCRIFPDEFDFIPLGGSKENPQPALGNLCTDYHVGMMNNAENERSAQDFINFLLCDDGAAIYSSHGLNKLR